MVVFALLACGLWIFTCLWRIQRCWERGESTILHMGSALRAADRSREEQEASLGKLEAEIAYIRKSTEKAREDEKSRRQELQRIVPPAPVDIEILREFPASATETPWTVDLRLRAGVKAPNARPQLLALFWAPAESSKVAYSRAKSLLEEYSLYAIENVFRFSGNER